ncbi:MAG TPA: hypothetical protein PLL10_06460, partial [Elusimicrobiales bacterium]|nr:hypothetical protein [Elusimicrobiales bacterium]
PTNFVLNQFNRYPVVLLGEYHWQTQQIAFVKSLIRPLVEQAGVKTFIFEFGDRHSQGIFDKFMQSSDLDSDSRALLSQVLGSVARTNPKSQNFQTEEYAGVYEELWRVSREHPGQVKVRLACSEPSEMDEINALLPFLRKYGCPVHDLESFMALDKAKVNQIIDEHEEEFRTLNSELTLKFDLQKDQNFISLASQALAAKEKTFVWAGRNHLIAHTRDFRRSIGYELNQRYPGKIFTAILHDAGQLPGTAKPFGAFMEKEILNYGRNPIAFPLNSGPFGEFKLDDTHVLRDIADGYIFLCPVSAYTQTTPLP